MSISPFKAVLCVISSFSAGYLLSQSYSFINPGGEDTKDSVSLNCAAGQHLSVEVTGAVASPGVYELTEGSRVVDAIEKAGGFTTDYDYTWVSKNLNLAQILDNEQKIFIPFAALGYELSKDTCEDRVFRVVEAENKTNESSSSSQVVAEPDSKGDKINVNEATSEELDTLPGVGSVYAQKIIAGRPYAGVEDFKEKSQLSDAVYEKIKDLIIF